VTDPARMLEVLDELAPLSHFYATQGQTPVQANIIDGIDMPQPYRGLLVHQNDMTPTLEAHHSELLKLYPLHVDSAAGELRRQVCLIGASSGRIVEFGAIRIMLDRFPEEPRLLIEQCAMPLGSILARYEVAHTCHPKAYLQLHAEAEIAEALGAGPGEPLFGRHNIIRNADGDILADIVEILPHIRTYAAP